jgi:methylmalonyl-CoA/ethylmalonyl-CoA epimerase
MKLETMRLDHVGFLVRDTEKTAKALLPLFSTIIEMRRAHSTQGVYISYLALPNKTSTIELVEPFPTNARLMEWLARENKASIPYHICLAVDEFDEGYRCMRKQGWLVLTKPFETFNPDIAACHLYRPEVGIIEITGARKR